MILSLTGPSGVGKTTLLHNLLRTLPNAHPLESITTRAPRSSDEPGEYRYVERGQFEAMESEGVFLWTAHSDTNRYGTRKVIVDSALGSGMYIPILVMQVISILYSYADRVHKKNELRLIYIHMNDEEELRKRLQERGDSAQSIERRIKECRSWHTDAKASGVPFLFLEGSLSREKLLEQSVAYMQN